MPSLVVSVDDIIGGFAVDEYLACDIVGDCYGGVAGDAVNNAFEFHFRHLVRLVYAAVADVRSFLNSSAESPSVSVAAVDSLACEVCAKLNALACSCECIVIKHFLFSLYVNIFLFVVCVGGFAAARRRGLVYLVAGTVSRS